MSETEEEIKIDVNLDEVNKVAKNTDGHLGAICKACGGYGFTLTFGGATNSAGCKRCDQTGIEPPDLVEMHTRLGKLEASIEELKKIIIKFGEKL